MPGNTLARGGDGIAASPAPVDAVLKEKGEPPNHVVPMALGKLRQKVQATETGDSLTLSRQLTDKGDVAGVVSGLDARLFQAMGYRLSLRDDSFAAGGIAVEIVRRHPTPTADGGEKLYGSICPPPSWHKSSARPGGMA
ncbi:hypothetical protein QMA67_05905 [Gluconobacter japonicus]|uniref:hypothetical protein n=1 Tax=Gluconobacter japonicus TaxID=376620 RepID=UPI0024AC8A34|nr:hypothetical protein [Gluconobacter japonicus]MDI6652475.1 hypothetical protein [Gluconobacter japonicus]